MPKIPINYNNTIIYKLVCNDIDIKDIYVGATTDMIRRKAQHKYKCNDESSKEYNRKIYQTIRNNGGFQNWTMLEVEQYQCTNKMESDIRERYWLELLNANMNMIIPSRTTKQWSDDNKEHLAIYQKEYKNTNRQQLKEYKKEYYDNHNERYNCCCGGIYTSTKQNRHNTSKKHLLYVISTLSNDPNVLDI